MLFRSKFNKGSGEKVDFDAWFALREPNIPEMHKKEIIKADFKGRGLGQNETIEDFDKALTIYGVKLLT